MAKRRLTVNLTDELVAALQGLAAQHNTTVTEELRKAIQDRSYFVGKIQEGADVILEMDKDGDGIKERTEVVLR